jgi:RNA polymerase sigma factor (sigma-70 family)
VPEPNLNFEDFFESEYPRLVGLLYLLTGRLGEAEDLAQEALARAYERWERVRVMESPGGYVYRIAVNLHRRRLRRFTASAWRLVGVTTNSDEISRAESRSDILRALRSLPRGQREAVVLVVWMGLDAAEAGTVLGIRGASVRSRLHRARAALRKELAVQDG